jgi:light-regulated signal transduction histidine kinase (bacteriophytochrome)
MKDKISKFEAAYKLSLQECLVGAGEIALQHGYELGRQAIRNGMGLMNVVTIHREALLSLLSQAANTKECMHIEKISQDLFSECIAPFELTHSGFIELESLNLRLEEANKELESFSYSISHDLRAPLRAIDGYSRMILKRGGDKFDENVRRQFNLIRNNIKLMGLLIEDLLSFSRVQKTDMNITVIDMDKLANKVWDEIQDANKERELSPQFKKLQPGYGDPILIRQVLFNLFSNSVKFTRNQKQCIIEISSYTDSGKNVYCIKDNGAGFDMAHYDKLFGVFQRLHSSEEYEGTGIGLAIVQRIIKRHGGKVWAEAEVGKGATFRFTLDGVPSDDAQERRQKKKNS